MAFNQKCNTLDSKRIVHQVITTAIENIIKLVITGSSWIVPKPAEELTFESFVNSKSEEN